MSNTCIHYRYADGANCKQGGSVIFSGLLSTTEFSALQDTLDSEGFFVPTAVGLPHLLKVPFDGDIDHPYHTIENIEPVDQPPTDSRTVAQLLTAFQEADWETAATEWTVSQ